MRFQSVRITLAFLAPLLVASPGFAQSFRVQCPTSTVTHPITAANDNNHEPAYTGPTTFVSTVAADPATPDSNDPKQYQKKIAVAGFLVPGPSAAINGAIKCQQISGGDGYATMADGTQTYMFSFGPLSGLTKMANGQPGTDFPDEFNVVYTGTPLQAGDPATTDDGSGYVPSQTTPPQPLTNPAFTYNGAVGLEPDADCLADNPGSSTACGNAAGIDGHVDPRQIEDIGVMNGNIPAPLMAVDEDDEFFLTLTNVGMIMRPDLFEQHTVHWHGYPNASALYDGVPEPSVAINIGGSFTYYYLAPDAGTYFWHCHITPPEHLQMGMVGQIYVRPRQNREPIGMDLYVGLELQQLDPRTACTSSADIMCSNPLPAPSAAYPTGDDGVKQDNDPLDTPMRPYHYAYNDGDGSTAYDVSYPIQIHGFDPNFHFIGMTFNAEPFVNMKDKYFLLNGRSYPDTVTPGPMQTESSDGAQHFSQPLSAIVNIPVGGKALLRLSDLDVTEFQTLASLGIRMTVIALNAKLLRDQAGHNLYYKTNSITLGGGESLDVMLDASVRDANGKLVYPPGSTYYLYTPNLDHLSNDAENFGGLMTEVHICPATAPNINPDTHACVVGPSALTASN